MSSDYSASWPVLTLGAGRSKNAGGRHNVLKRFNLLRLNESALLMLTMMIMIFSARTVTVLYFVVVVNEQKA